MKQQKEGTAINFMRLRGLIRKESRQIIRDPSSIGIAFFLPILLLLIFGYGVSLDASHVPLAVVIEKSSPQAMSLVSGFNQSGYFQPIRMNSIQEAEQALMHRRVDGIIWLRQNFDRRLLSGKTAPIGVIVNGVDSNKARLVEGYVTGVWYTWLQRRAQEMGRSLRIPVTIEPRIWFNAAVRSRNYLVPGLIAIIMTLIGAMLTSMVVAREWERGTMEALMVTPVTMKEIILSKIIPYFFLGMGGMLLSVIMAVFLFQVPLRGSLPALIFSSSLFMLTAITMGLLISVAAKSQFIAGQIAIVITFLPAFILSGFVFDIRTMPVIIQGLTYLVAARYFVDILQTLFLAGNVWPLLLINSFWLGVMGLVFLLIIKKKSRKLLE
ncbi:ABC-type efflux pump permease component YbhS [hydrothermal vent metagenome]|uniref:ABC-type efflux pump permease component YbhS n=1 Tax=hydrothermal vent metagenome TaxID=652676 RepID=A0A3B0WBK9_9ZZZZ